MNASILSGPGAGSDSSTPFTVPVDRKLDSRKRLFWCGPSISLFDGNDQEQVAISFPPGTGKGGRAEAGQELCEQAAQSDGPSRFLRQGGMEVEVHDRGRIPPDRKSPSPGSPRPPPL